MSERTVEIFRSEYDEILELTPQDDSEYVCLTMTDQEGDVAEICVDRTELMIALKKAIKIMKS